MNRTIALAVLCLVALIGASPVAAEDDSAPSKPPAEVAKEAGTKIGHAFRDAAREIGHASRDAWKESAGVRREAGEEAKEVSGSMWQNIKTGLRDAWRSLAGSPDSTEE